MIPVLFFVASLLGALATAMTLLRFRRPAVLSFWIMFTGWLTGEAVPFHLVWQGVATAVWIALGALDEPIGVVGLAVTGVSWVGLVVAHRVALGAWGSGDAALRRGLGDHYDDAYPPEVRRRLDAIPRPRVVLRPFRFAHPDVEVVRDLRYGDHPTRNLLDVYRSRTPGSGRPVLLQIHGGAWVIGEKNQQALPLMNHLAANGWVCVSINYRLGPKHRFPDFLVDSKRALSWIRANIADYGGDPATVVVTGESAGGHLATLVALTAGQPRYQPGFEDADTSVVACIPVYGPTDFLDRLAIRGRSWRLAMMLAARYVMPGPPTGEHAALWDDVSPILAVTADAPPFLVIQGTHDVLVWREETRHFVSSLAEVSRQPIVYWEVPGAQHAFDIFRSPRCLAAVEVVDRWLSWLAATGQLPATDVGRSASRAELGGAVDESRPIL